MTAAAELASIADAGSLEAFLSPRFDGMPGAGEGVLHVAAVWRPRDGSRQVVLRIEQRTPKSEIDFLLLNLARARADAIVTTGRILREEPGVVHDLLGPPGIVAALREWRGRLAGLDRPPLLLVLTSGRDLDPAHPAFHGWSRPVLLCPQERAATVSERVGSVGLEVVARPETGLRAVLDYLRRERGARRISIEAGPSTAAAAYRPPVAIDELLLSVLTADTLEPSIAGGELPPLGELRRRLGPPRAVWSAEEKSGRWRFERYLRAGAPR